MMKNSDNNNNISFTDKITNIIKIVFALDFKKDKKNEGIFYNSFIFQNIKIICINLLATDLIALGIFPREMNSGIIRLFLFNLIISYINYVGDKNDYFNSPNFKKLNSIDKINLTNFNNFIYSKIYDTFLSIPVQIHFWKNAEKVFKKRTLYIKDIYYKNFFLIDLDKRRIILNAKSLQNNNINNKGCRLNISKKKKIWKELIFYCKKLRKDYIKKNDMNFNEFDYKNFFVKIEYKSTYPQRTFIIKFLPLLTGMCIIHEYIEFKLPIYDKDEKKKINKERNIILGYDYSDNIFKNISNNFFENEHNVLKQIHFFITESLLCSNFLIKNIFCLKKSEKIYFSEEVLDIIKEEFTKYIKKNIKFYSNLTSSNHNFYSKKIIKYLLNILYEEYIQINNKEKILHRSSSALPLDFMHSIFSDDGEGCGDNFSLLKLNKEKALFYLFSSIKLNKNVNPNDITIDLNDENGKSNERDSIKKINDLIEKNSNIRFSDILSEKSDVPKNIKIKETKKINNKFYCINPFPLDSQEDYDDIKSNGGYFDIKNENDSKYKFKSNYDNKKNNNYIKYKNSGKDDFNE